MALTALQKSLLVNIVFGLELLALGTLFEPVAWNLAERECIVSYGTDMQPPPPAKECPHAPAHTTVRAPSGPVPCPFHSYSALQKSAHRDVHRGRFERIEQSVCGERWKQQHASTRLALMLLLAVVYKFLETAIAFFFMPDDAYCLERVPPPISLLVYVPAFLNARNRRGVGTGWAPVQMDEDGPQPLASGPEDERPRPRASSGRFSRYTSVGGTGGGEFVPRRHYTWLKCVAELPAWALFDVAIPIVTISEAHNGNVHTSAWLVISVMWLLVMNAFRIQAPLFFLFPQARRAARNARAAYLPLLDNSRPESPGAATFQSTQSSRATGSNPHLAGIGTFQDKPGSASDLRQSPSANNRDEYQAATRAAQAALYVPPGGDKGGRRAPAPYGVSADGSFNVTVRAMKDTKPASITVSMMPNDTFEQLHERTVALLAKRLGLDATNLRFKFMFRGDRMDFATTMKAQNVVNNTIITAIVDEPEATEDTGSPPDSSRQAPSQTLLGNPAGSRARVGSRSPDVTRKSASPDVSDVKEEDL